MHDLRNKVALLAPFRADRPYDVLQSPDIFGCAVDREGRDYSECGLSLT